MRRTRRAASALAAVLAASCASSHDDPDVIAAARVDLSALAARSAPDGDPGTVDVLLAPDDAFLGRLGRDAVPALVDAVGALDRFLGPEVGLRFRVGGAVPFAATQGADDARRLLWEARLGLRRGRCDVVAAFTGQGCGPRAGTAEPALRIVLCADAVDPAGSLLRETALLFGARDYPDGHPGRAEPGVMSRDPAMPRSLRFDPATLERLRARRGPFLPAPPDPVVAALESRAASWPGSAAEDLREVLLAAAGGSQQDKGLAPGERLRAAVPGDVPGARALAECLRRLKRPEDARPRFLETLQLVSRASFVDALDRLAVVETGRLVADETDGLGTLRPAAEEALAVVSVRFPGDAEILGLRGSLRARAGDRAAAGRLYREAAASARDDARPWLDLAALARAEGDADAWLAAWRGARKADPLDAALAIRWIEEGMEEYPDLILSDDLRREVDGAIEGAERLYPRWTRPAELRLDLRDRRR